MAMVQSGSGAGPRWRVLLFVVIGWVPAFVLLGMLPAWGADAAAFGWVALVTWFMGRREGQAWGTFGLPGREAFGRRFWQGAAWGAVALTVLLLLILASGDFGFGTRATHGAVLAKYAGLWAASFLAVGLFEEFCFRGYVLTTMAEGMGFWPAAIILSVIFGGLHLGNHGEGWIGAVSAGLIGLFFCFTRRRTGSLWFAVGLHAAWDYCESFVYGVPDSGVISPGRMLTPTFHGSKWITGGTIGPEGSVWVFVVITLLFVGFAGWQGSARGSVERHLQQRIPG